MNIQSIANPVAAATTAVMTGTGNGQQAADNANSRSGGTMLAHSFTAATLGTSITGFMVWLLQTYAHFDPPAIAAQMFSAIGFVLASYLMAMMAKASSV